MRSSLHDLALRMNERHVEAAEMLDEAGLVEDALREGGESSPNDPALPYLIFGLAKLYSDIGTEDSRSRKDAVLEWLTSSFLLPAVNRRGPSERT